MRPVSPYDVVDTLIFNDHHTYRVSDIRKMEQLLGLYEDAVIVTTEKDAVKLTNRSPAYAETVQRNVVLRARCKFHSWGIPKPSSSVKSSYMLERIKSTASFIRSKVDFDPQVGIILGTGLGGLA